MLAIPNFSEGRDPVRLAALEQALTSVAGVRVLDVHTDPDHNRSVYTLVDVGGAASSGLVDALLAGAATAIELLDIAAHQGVHPRIGALDVAPIVYMNDSERGAACAQALTLSDRLGHELGIPVFLYGLLTDWRVTRAEIRRGGPRTLQQRIDAGELTPDFGPRRLHPRAGAVLVSARPPLVAFNVELGTAGNPADGTRYRGADPGRGAGGSRVREGDRAHAPAPRLRRAGLDERRGLPPDHARDGGRGDRQARDAPARGDRRCAAGGGL